MNFLRTVSTLAVAATSLALSPALYAQAAAAAPAAAPTTLAPEAIPAKIALISFEQAVFATNEGQKSIQDLQAKYLPKKNQIDAAGKEVDSLKQQLQAGGANLSETEKANRVRTIDTKEKQLQRDGEDASAAYQADLQEAYGKIAQKVNGTMQGYAAQKGFTLVLDVSNQQQSNVMYADTKTDITRAVIDAYNTSSGVPAPPPAAPGASAPTRTTPRTAPRPTTPR